MTFDSARLDFAQVAGSLPPAAIEEYRVERLLELRAVIDALRTERASELLRDAQAERERYAHL